MGPKQIEVSAWQQQPDQTYMCTCDKCLRYLGLHLRHEVVQFRSRVLDRPSAEVKLRQKSARTDSTLIGGGGEVCNKIRTWN